MMAGWGEYFPEDEPPVAFSETEIRAWTRNEIDVVYADDVANDPTLSAALTSPFLFAGYVVWSGAAFFLRGLKRAVRGVRKSADDADRRVTGVGLAVLLALMFTARYGVYALAAIGGGR